MEDADGEVYAKHAEELIRFATALALAGPFNATDVLADAVVRVFTSPSWKSVTNRRAYLYRAVLNEARLRRRSLDRRLKREANAAVPPIDDADDMVDAADIARALRTLTVRQRAVVYETYWLGLDVGEVAGDLELSARTVERELARARSRLKELLG
jgi:RNA polymerase sigma-70 factor (ECF subfamily)